ncbi:MAG: hypothetical protein MZV63_58940 [Marinilabiliales bacterium]|nr:hypothetical protein [Marinilabiliales bacterium]
MKEIGMLNRQIDSALNRQGHMDGLMVVDAGFPCPDDVELIDIALCSGETLGPRGPGGDRARALGGKGRPRRGDAGAQPEPFREGCRGLREGGRGRSDPAHGIEGTEPRGQDDRPHGRFHGLGQRAARLRRRSSLDRGTVTRTVPADMVRSAAPGRDHRRRGRDGTLRPSFLYFSSNAVSSETMSDRSPQRSRVSPGSSARS